MRRRRPSPATVLALIALVFAMAGTGVAARSYVITSSSQIKNGAVTGADVRDSSLTGRDIKNRSLTAADFAGSVRGPAGAPGAQGAQGPQGTQGPKGDRGVSAWETIPSGVTVTGSKTVWMPSAGNDALYSFSIDLGARAPVALADATVNFAGAQSLFRPDGDLSCTGSPAAPTAPPGKVCLYLADGYMNLEDVEGFAQPVGGDLSFQVRWHATSAVNSMRWTATWAYTAP